MTLLADTPTCTTVCTVPWWQAFVVGVSGFVACALTGLVVWLLIHYGEKKLREEADEKDPTLHRLVGELAEDDDVEDMSKVGEPKYSRK